MKNSGTPPPMAISPPSSASSLRIPSFHSIRSNKEGSDTAEVNSTGIENRTALHWAIYENKVDAAKRLLEYGANAEAKTLHGRTALHVACILGEDKMCAVMISAGASVNALDLERNTPVHYAAFYSNTLYLNE